MRCILVRLFGWAALLASVALFPARSEAIPTPRLSEAEMLKAADLVVEGQIVGVVLAKRWIGNTSSDQGYEQGNFRSWVLVTKVLKGPSEANDTVELFTHAYKEGTWANAPRFVYEETEAAITPGNRVRFYLKWDPKLKQYERVQFNSGFILLEQSKGQHPTQVGQPALWGLGKDGK